MVGRQLKVPFGSDRPVLLQRPAEQAGPLVRIRIDSASAALPLRKHAIGAGGGGEAPSPSAMLVRREAAGIIDCDARHVRREQEGEAQAVASEGADIPLQPRALVVAFVARQLETDISGRLDLRRRHYVRQDRRLEQRPP